jgi:hypothetical protein
MTLYQHVYDGIHGKSGPGMPLKQFYIQTEYEACMGWVSPRLESHVLFVGVKLHTTDVRCATL